MHGVQVYLPVATSVACTVACTVTIQLHMVVYDGILGESIPLAACDVRN